jgi:hypothetical protein
VGLTQAIADYSVQSDQMNLLIAQKVAQPIFVKINTYITFTVENDFVLKIPNRRKFAQSDRCYGLYTFFAEKFSEKNVYDSKQSKVMQKFDHNIGIYLRKTLIFCLKLAKIAENCDHNIDPLICDQLLSV